MPLISRHRTIDGEDVVEYFGSDERSYKIPIMPKHPSIASTANDPYTGINIEEYLIQSNECFLKFPEGHVEKLPDNYYIGAQDPRTVQGNPTIQNSVPLGSLWHDTDNGLLKKLTASSNYQSIVGPHQVWLNVQGTKYVADDDGNVVGKIVLRVSHSLNNPSSNGDLTAMPLAIPKAPPPKLADLIDRAKSGDLLEDDEDEDAD